MRFTALILPEFNELKDGLSEEIIYPNFHLMQHLN